MLKWLVAALGAVLLVLGVAMATVGWSIVTVERGWSQFIAGSAMATGGCLILAIAAAIARIDALIAGVDLFRRTGASFDAPVAPPVDVPPPFVAASPEPLPADFSQPAPAPVEPPADIPAELPPIEIAPVKREDRARPSIRPIPLKPRRPTIPGFGASPKPVEAASEPIPFRIPERSVLLKGRWPEADDMFEQAAPAESPPAPAVETPAPEAEKTAPLVRRYESGGVAYQLFADGSIEAQMESGSYRFASLAELRTFIENKKK